MEDDVPVSPNGSADTPTNTYLGRLGGDAIYSTSEPHNCDTFRCFCGEDHSVLISTFQQACTKATLWVEKTNQAKTCRIYRLCYQLSPDEKKPYMGALAGEVLSHIRTTSCNLTKLDSCRDFGSSSRSRP
jgi:hypothetical protein